MHIQRAQSLTPGQKVRFPADRGKPAGSAKVVEAGSTIHTNLSKTEFIWVNLGPCGVWPSNRLA